MKRTILIGLLATVLGGGLTMGQTGEDEKTVGWFNTTELSLVITEGNSNTDTFSFKNVATRVWERSRVSLLFDGMRANTSEDRFLLADPGQTFPPGEDSPNLSATQVVTPAKEPDAEKYFLEGRFTKKLGGRRSWNAGGSWDRNEDAGILNRYIVFGGVGNHWKSGEKLDFETAYGLSFTDREEETPDPEKEQRFAGTRITVDLDYRVWPTTTLSYDFTGNLNVEDTSDYSVDTSGSLSVSMNRRVALKASLQLLYNSEPALEDVDVVALLEIIDPDGTPGNGDEYFLTVADGGLSIEIREARVRKENQDIVFRTSLVVNF